MKESPLVIGLAIVGVLGVAGLKYASFRYESRLPQGEPATIAKISKIKPGMTRGQVEAIIGVPGYSPTSSPNSTLSEETWTNHNLSGAGVLYENGRVINVTRMGLLPDGDYD